MVAYLIYRTGDPNLRSNVRNLKYSLWRIFRARRDLRLSRNPIGVAMIYVTILDIWKIARIQIAVRNSNCGEFELLYCNTAIILITGFHCSYNSQFYSTIVQFEIPLRTAHLTTANHSSPHWAKAQQLAWHQHTVAVWMHFLRSQSDWSERTNRLWYRAVDIMHCHSCQLSS